MRGDEVRFEISLPHQEGGRHDWGGQSLSLTGTGYPGVREDQQNDNILGTGETSKLPIF